MLHFLFFLFFIVIVILLAGLSIVGSIVRSIFGLGRRPSSANQSQSGRQTYTRNEQETPNAKASTSPTHKKIFADDEGEYVDFEEIKN